MSLASLEPCPEPALPPEPMVPAVVPRDRVAEAICRLNAFNAELLGGATATATLEKWAGTPVQVASVAWGDEPLSAGQRCRLQLGTEDACRHRRVRLACAGRCLVEAEIWYLPGRLTPAMNARLTETDTPFGRVVASLQPSRRTICAKPALLAAPEGQDLVVGVPVLEIKAVVYARGGLPIAEVRERFAPDLLTVLLAAER